MNINPKDFLEHSADLEALSQVARIPKSEKRGVSIEEQRAYEAKKRSNIRNTARKQKRGW